METRTHDGVEARTVMKRSPKTTTGAALALSSALLLGATAPGARAQQGPVATHIQHVLTEAPDTPEGRGYLTTAEDEAAVAIRHAELAANDDTNLDWMQTHASHVLHALDPSRVEGEGPGLGYGLQNAASQIARHIGLAAEAEGASGGVETHSAHVIAATNAVASRAEELAGLAQEVLDAGDYSSAGSRVYRMRRLARQLITGVDVDEDGEVSWQEPEGGLAQVRRHAELMAEAAGL